MADKNKSSKKELVKKVLMAGGTGMLLGTGAGYMMRSGKDIVNRTGRIMNPINKGPAGPIRAKMLNSLASEVDNKYFPYLVGGGTALANIGRLSYKEHKKRRAKKREA